MKPKVIAGADIGDVQQWSVPSVQGAQSPRPASAGMVTANQTEKIQQKAYQDGFERGLNEGRTAGRNELQDKIQSLHSIASLLNAPLTTLDDEVVNEVTTLAITIAKHMIRRELAADPGEIVAVVQQAMNALPVAKRNARLYLHPEDAKLVNDSYGTAEHMQGTEIIEDPGLSRGGCRIVTDSSRIDATIENRIAAIVSELMGGAREGDDAGNRSCKGANNEGRHES